MPHSTKTTAHWVIDSALYAYSILLWQRRHRRKDRSSSRRRRSPLPTALSQATWLLLWVTYERGFFRKYGLDVQIVFIESGSTTVQNLISKEVAFAQMRRCRRYPKSSPEGRTS